MISAFIRRGDGTIVTDGSPQALADAMNDPAAVFWVDIEAPSDAEYALLSEVFKFHPLAIEDTTQHLQRPKIDEYFWGEPKPDSSADYYYIVLHGPDPETVRVKDCSEVDIFLSDRFLITIHDSAMPSITDRRNRAKTSPKAVLDLGPDRLLYLILDGMVDQYQPLFDELSEALDELDEIAASDAPPRDLPRRISEKKRQLLYLRTLVGPQREVLAQMARGDVHVIRENTRIYLRDVQDHLIRLYENVELYRDIVMGARDIYLSSISNHLNQIMKTLTIISVIAMPLTVITSFFGMNFDAIPGLHDPRGFWLAVAGMALAEAGMLYLFWKKRWI